jgi:hypothetical protein
MGCEALRRHPFRHRDRATTINRSARSHSPDPGWKALAGDAATGILSSYQKGKLGLFELMDVKEYTTGILGRKADIMTRDSLHKMLKQDIEASAIRVF